MRSHVFRKLFMESVLLKGKFGKFKHRPILAQFLMDKRGCRTVKVKATEPYYIRATFLPLRHFSIFLVRDTIVYIG